MEDVALGRLRDGEDARRLAGRQPDHRVGVEPGRPAGQILREAQVDAVVNRDHRAAGYEGGQHVVRGVEQIRPLAPKVHRDAQLFAD